MLLEEWICKRVISEHNSPSRRSNKVTVKRVNTCRLATVEYTPSFESFIHLSE